MNAPSAVSLLVGPALKRGGVERASKLYPGAGLIMSREPSNPKDFNAIELLQDDDFVGYIQRPVAAIIAPWMDKGIVYLCSVISGPEIRFKKGRIYIGWIYLRCTPLPPLTGKKSTKVKAPIRELASY